MSLEWLLTAHCMHLRAMATTEITTRICCSPLVAWVSTEGLEKKLSGSIRSLVGGAAWRTLFLGCDRGGSIWSMQPLLAEAQLNVWTTAATRQEASLGIPWCMSVRRACQRGHARG